MCALSARGPPDWPLPGSYPHRDDFIRYLAGQRALLIGAGNSGVPCAEGC
jgi:hypothetical protein